MLSWKLSRSLEFTLENVSIPTITGDELLVKIQYAGVCHTDLHLLEDGYDIGRNMKKRFTERSDIMYPVTPGHEISGIVYAVAGNIAIHSNSVNIGDKVIVYPWIHCGICKPCVFGACHLCSRPYQREIGQCDQGGYSQYVVVPNSKYVIKVPEDVAMDTAALLPCSGATAFNALRHVMATVHESTAIYGNSRVMIVGLGGLGLWCIRLSKAVLPLTSCIIAMDINEEKLFLGQEAGANETLLWQKENASEDDRSLNLKYKKRLDAVIDFVNTPQTNSIALKWIRNGGRVVAVGLMGGSVEISLPMFTLQNKSLQGVGTTGIVDVKDVVKLVAKHKISPPPITHYRLEDTKQALEDLKQGKISGRAVLKMTE